MNESASLSEKIALRRAARLASAPESARGLLARCYNGTASPRQAIKSFCHDCVGFDRAAVKECTSFACSLWPYRPYQSKDQ